MLPDLRRVYTRAEEAREPRRRNMEIEDHGIQTFHRTRPGLDESDTRILALVTCRMSPIAHAVVNLDAGSTPKSASSLEALQAGFPIHSYHMYQQLLTTDNSDYHGEWIW